MSDQPPQGNNDFAWAKFDPEEYVAHYYGEPHPDDDEALRLTCVALAEGAKGGRTLECIDIGTGPNLFPLLAAAPVAKSVTVWEYAESNIEWMRRELERPLRPPWTHFWDVARSAHGARADAIAEPAASLAAMTEIKRGSIFDVPARNWDSATMFFCAESITQRQDEFERACAAFAGAVRPGGVLAAAFLAGSRGYRVGEEDYPALCIGPEELRQTFSGIAKDISLTLIGAQAGEIRSGYSGMIFLSARAI